MAKMFLRAFPVFSAIALLLLVVDESRSLTGWTLGLFSLLTGLGFYASVRDIAGQKQLDEELRLERNIFTAGPVIAFKWKATQGWPVEYVSPAIEQLGYRGADFSSGLIAYADIVYSEDLDRVAMEVASHSESGADSFEQDYRIVRADGEIRWLHDLTHVIRNDEGEITHYHGYVLDITDRKKTESALRESEQRYRQLFDGSKAVKLIVDPSDGAIIDANATASVFYGYSLEGLRTLNVSDINTLPSADLAVEMQAVNDGRKNHFMFRHQLSSGEIRHVEVYSHPVIIAGCVLLSSIIHDVTDRVRAERALVESERRLNAILDTTTALIFLKDRAGKYILVNRQYELFMGRSQSEIFGRTDEELFAKQGAQSCQLSDQQVLETGRSIQVEEIVTGADGGEHTFLTSKTPLFNASGDIYAVCGIAADISDRKLAEEKVWYQANFDYLTGLPNRALFLDRLAQSLRAAKRDKVRGALMFIDLDKFKWVNDSLGHHAGDLLLVETANRLSACVRESDTVARLGGDEFTVMLPNIQSVSDVEAALEKIQGCLNRRFELCGREISISGSIGISLYPDDGEDVETMLKNADRAMYQVKEDGRNGHCFFTPE